MKPISFISNVQSTIRAEVPPAGGAAPGTGVSSGQGQTQGAPSAGTSQGGAGPGGTTPGGGAASGAPSFDWAAQGLDAETLGFVQSKGYKTPGDVVSAYRGAEKLLGVPADQVIKLPQGEYNQDLMNKNVFDKLGRPPTAADYKLPVPQGQTPEYANEVSKWFHEAGLTAKQAQMLAEKSNGYLQQQMGTQGEATKAEQTRQLSELKATWGNDFDKNTGIVDRAAEAFGMKPEQIGALKGAMGVKGAMEFLHNIGSRLPTDDNFVSPEGRTNTFNGGLSVEQATTRKAELMKDKGFSARFSKGDADAKAEMMNLNRIISPGSITV